MYKHGETDKLLNFNMFDAIDAVEVHFFVDTENKCWLNVDGKCIARIGLADRVVIEDARRKKE